LYLLLQSRQAAVGTSRRPQQVPSTPIILSHSSVILTSTS